VTGPPPPGKVQGIVSKWTAKGFGFIAPEDGGEELFCHFSAIEDGNALQQGSVVHFVKKFDEVKGRERAVQVAGGFQEARIPGGGGGAAGGFNGGGGYGYGGGGGGAYGGGGFGGAYGGGGFAGAAYGGYGGGGYPNFPGAGYGGHGMGVNMADAAQAMRGLQLGYGGDEAKGPEHAVKPVDGVQDARAVGYGGGDGGYGGGNAGGMVYGNAGGMGGGMGGAGGYGGYPGGGYPGGGYPGGGGGGGGGQW